MADRVEVTARRSGTRGDVLALNLPVPMSRAIPGGNHRFTAEFVPEGILLRYLGPATPGKQRGAVILDPPEWGQDA